MSYTHTNFKTKKALKDAVAAWNEYKARQSYPVNVLTVEAVLNNKFGTKVMAPEPVTCYQPGLGPPLGNLTGTVYLEGPHYPEPHRWYATAELVDGVVVKVR